jgi:hypothetical protein
VLYVLGPGGDVDWLFGGIWRGPGGGVDVLAVDEIGILAKDVGQVVLRTAYLSGCG